jgi:hypothetical protein
MKHQMNNNRLILAGALILFASAACHRGGNTPSEITPEESKVPAVSSVSGLVQAMRDKYAETWYKSLSFTQVNRYTIGGKEQKSEWLENLSVPAKLRIDFLPLTQKSGLLIDNSRVRTFSAGKQIDSRRLFQPRPLLLSDIYVLPVNVTMRRLDSLGIDTTRLRVQKDGGKRFFVMGAESGDMTSVQAWFDAETLLLSRFIQTEDRAGKKVTSDMRVTSYVDVAGFPVPEAFVTSREGATTLREEYTKVKVNVPMSTALFDPAKFGTVKVSQ